MTDNSLNGADDLHVSSLAGNCPQSGAQTSKVDKFIEPHMSALSDDHKSAVKKVLEDGKPTENSPTTVLLKTGESSRPEYTFTDDDIDLDEDKITLTRKNAVKYPAKKQLSSEEFVHAVVVDGEPIDKAKANGKEICSVEKNAIKAVSTEITAYDMSLPDNHPYAASLNALLAERDTLRDERKALKEEAAKKLGKKVEDLKPSDWDMTEYNSKNVAAVSGKIGELYADVHVQKEFPDFKRIHPEDIENAPSLSGNFDMVYQNDAGEIIIIEAKGAGGTTGTRNINGIDYEQGTTEYAANVTQSMASKRVSSNFSDEKNSAIRKEVYAARAIKFASQDDKSIRYFRVQTPIENDPSAVDSVKVSEYQIDKLKLKSILDNDI
ncbi:hypothetical protein EUZ85_07945 [Hahella sp. KA22]|uniref:hypothetical protein n=1 Tax=Hahella sp. KA22 TaxID=1628392 RepID=UPI000FDEA1E5|nr:hypothetical protein [Hahella sp. KA22]AZZ90652.1 hypothetical protein ENC22_05390 [Hahella sp. KA22]QAY54023.1 hypothetical protein EUZ85_07945 [Hahella sp. KA22]